LGTEAYNYCLPLFLNYYLENLKSQKHVIVEKKGMRAFIVLTPDLQPDGLIRV